MADWIDQIEILSQSNEPVQKLTTAILKEWVKAVKDLQASNARLIKAIEPLLPDIRFYMDITDKNLDDEEQITLTVRELAELAAAAKEGADGNTKS